MKTQNALLIIDAQNDFCHPEGALSVPGAVEDAQRLAKFIEQDTDELDYICLTIDSHPIHDISHPSYWKNAEGKHPAPFTNISVQEVEAGTWKPLFNPEETLTYLKALERQGEFPHIIWPHHCLMGSWGNAIYKDILDATIRWAEKTGKNYRTEIKGTNPQTEHFGIFQAQVPVENQPETQRNQRLLDELNQFERVFLAGQAKSHCVATSLKQIMDFEPTLAQKVVILSDTMSDVPNLGHLGDPIYARAKKEGLRFQTAMGKLS